MLGQDVWNKADVIQEIFNNSMRFGLTDEKVLFLKNLKSVFWVSRKMI